MICNDLSFRYRKSFNKMLVKDLKEFIFENYYKQTGCAEEDSCYSLGMVKKRFTIICY